MAGDTARQALRQATDAAHERLHHLPAFASLAAGRIGRDEYVALLRRLLGFHRAVEAALAAAPSLRPFGIAIEERRRAPLLEADLDALDAMPGLAAPPVAPPVAPLAAPPASAAAAMGWLYVVEGSTLGGRHLARGLDGLLGEAEAGRRFLLGHGARHGAMWRACCEAIEQCGATPGGMAAMIEGANDAFRCFEDWFAAETA